MPLVAGGFLILGSVIGFVSNWLLDKRKSNQDAKTRYLDRQLDYASVMLEQAETVLKAVRRVGWQPMTSASAAHQATMMDALAEIKKASTKAQTAHRKFAIIAPKSIRQPALDLNAAILYARTIGDDARAKDALKKLTDAKKKFEVACQKQFGAG